MNTSEHEGAGFSKDREKVEVQWLFYCLIEVVRVVRAFDYHIPFDSFSDWLCEFESALENLKRCETRVSLLLWPDRKRLSEILLRNGFNEQQMRLLSCDQCPKKTQIDAIKMQDIVPYTAKIEF